MAKTKRSGSKMTQKEKKAAQMAAYRKARMQWYILGAVLVVAVIAAIVLVTIFTDGQAPIQTAPNGALIVG